MAKKKASAKKANVKKVAKKTASKKTVKKVTKKTAPAKKKPVGKKAAPKKVVKKAVSKAPVKKAAPKKAASKKSTVSASHLVKAVAPLKKVDLSEFVTPLGDRILVQASGAEKMTAGGLYIPDTVADTSGNLEGYVVAVGRGHMNKKGHVRPMDVKVGDRVVFSEYAGSKVKIQNEDLVILREGDVMGVVSK